MIAIGLIAIVSIFVFSITYWPLTLFIIGVVIINIYTFWATLIVFFLSIAGQVYDKVSSDDLTTHNSFSEVLVSSFKLTLYTVLVALALNFFFEILGSGGSSGACSRISAQYC